MSHLLDGPGGAILTDDTTGSTTNGYQLTDALPASPTTVRYVTFAMSFFLAFIILIGLV